jgi:hypothetical protein
MGIGIKDVGIDAMDGAGLDRLLADVVAFDPEVFDLLRKNHDHETAMKLMQRVHGLVELGYPIPEAIATVEEIYYPAGDTENNLAIAQQNFMNHIVSALGVPKEFLL